MSKAKKSSKGKRAASAKPKTQRPTVLVLEGLSGAANAVKRAGGNGVGVSPFNLDAVDKALRGEFDAILLTGGGDVDPRLYGEKPHKQTYGVNETRDLSEWMALDEAKARGIPVLGICRGMQLMVVHNGGRLKQHVTGHRGVDHPITAEDDSTFGKTIGGSMMTVSLHHQVAVRHGRGFRVAARDQLSGMIEAVESRDGRCLGVQFHPEMNFGTNADSRAIFRWLVTEAATRAGMPVPAERKPQKVKPAWSAWNDDDWQPRSRPAAPAPKHRSAGQPTLPGLSDSARAGHVPSGTVTSATTGRDGRKLRGVTITWQCPHCPLRFDEMEDRDDHQVFVHGDMSPWGLEPPQGHADWD